MGVRVRPLNRRDLVNMTGVVDKITSAKERKNMATTESEELFYNKAERGNRDYEEQGPYNRRAYIDLALPVCNYYLGNKRLELLGTILKKSKEEIDKISKGVIIYDMDEGEQDFRMQPELRRKRYDAEKMLIGGQYVKKLLEDLDVEEELRAIMRIPLKKLLSLESVVDVDSVGNIIRLSVSERQETDIWIVDHYYFRGIKVPFNKEFAKQIEEDLQPVRMEWLHSKSRRMTLLLAIRDDKSKVIDQVQDFIVVNPIGFRESTEDNRVNPITKAYNAVLAANNELTSRLMYKSATVESVSDQYGALVKAIKDLTVENLTHKEDEHYQPLAEQLKGKTGLIRDRMEGERIDYSGRSVIIVDPDMSVDTIGLPLNIAMKLAELRIIQNAGNTPSERMDILRENKKKQREELARKLVEGEYILVGRQPTLYYLGIRAFKAHIVTGNAIVLNPLSTPAFNADFDGDQMHTEETLTLLAREEAKVLMASTSNLFYSRDGSCHIAPRQDIIHGLWKACTVSKPDKANCYTIPDSLDGYRRVYNDVIEQAMNVYDIITVGGSTPRTAGKVAIAYALGWNTYGRCCLNTWPLVQGHINDKPVTEKWFAKVLGKIALENTKEFVTVTNRLVKLGFTVAGIYPPNMSVLKAPDVSDIIADFDKRISEREEYYNLGFETEASFTAFYNKEYSLLEDTVKKELQSRLGDSCGYLDMVKSGARGSMSNVMQLFGMKGRMMKNEQEAFNAILEQPLVSQLTSLEHFVTAYGSRQGLIDKTISTFEPGYMYRKDSHTSALMQITSKDCGTDDGLLLDFDFIKQFIPNDKLTGDDKGDSNTVKEYTARLLVGRYVVGRDEMVTTEEEAGRIYDEFIADARGNKFIKHPGLKLRSPLKCKNPCCVKCYGINLATNRMAVVGQPVGFLAAQSICEIGTQLIMKNFQSGGVAGRTNLTSSFDIMEKYMHLSDLRGKASVPIGYNFIAPVAGEIQTVSRGDGTKQVRILAPNKKGELSNKLRSKILVYENVKLKESVEVGETIQVEQGDLNMVEVLAVRGADYGERYVTMKLFDIFQSSNYVNLKHFEVLVSGMVFYKCLRGNKYFKTGLDYTIFEYHSHDRTDCIFEKVMHGVNSVPSKRVDVFSTMFMEDLGAGISESVIVSGYDSLTNPIVRMAFGLGLGMGTDCPTFLEERRSQCV